MALDPRLALAGRPAQVQQPDLLRTMLATAQLREMDQQGQLRDLAFRNALRQQDEEARWQQYLRGLGTEAPSPGLPAPAETQTPLAERGPMTLPGQAAALRRPSGLGIDPQAALRAGGERALPLIAADRQLQHEDLLRQNNQLKQMDASIDFAQKALSLVGDQASLDAAREQIGQVSETMAGLLPRTYDPAAIETQLRRMQLGRQRLQQQQTGFTPIYGTQNGKTTFVLPTNQGTVVQPQLPEGFQLAPQPQFLNLGTSHLGIDRRTGQPLTQVPIDVAGEAAQRAGGKEAGEHAGKLPQLRKKAQTTLEALDQKQRLVLDSIDKALQQSAGAFPTTGGVGALTKGIPGTPAHDLASTLETIGANIGFAELQAIRDASPTGGALGPVSDREGEFLRATLGSLKQSQSQQQFQENLRSLKTYLLESKQRRLDAYQRDFGTLPRGEPNVSPYGHLPVESLSPQQLDEEEAWLKRQLGR